MYVCAHLSTVCPVNAEENIGSLEMELQAAVSHPPWVLGTKLGPLPEQQVHLAMEPSLQPQRLTWLLLCAIHFGRCVSI